MSARDKGTFDLYTRGHELWSHKLAMFVKAAAINSLIGVLAGAAIYFSLLRVALDKPAWDVYWYNRIASVETAAYLGENGMLARDVEVDGQYIGRSNPAELVDATDAYYNEHVRFKSWLAFLISIVGVVSGGLYVGRFWHAYGKKKSEDVVIEGATLVEKDELIRIIKKQPPGAGAYSIAGVPIPKGKEMRNILFTGAQGVGKSQLILPLMHEVADAGRKMIIYDNVGEAVESLYRPDKDYIMNPFDARYPGHNFFKEVTQIYEFQQLAFSLIPNPENGDASALYFANAARTVFFCAMEKLWMEGRRTTDALADVLLTFSPAEMAEYLEGTQAAQFINPKAAEQAGGVLSTMVNALQVLRYVPSGDFSIKEWIAREDDSRLFITSNEGIHDIVKPLISMYVDIALRSAMTLPRSHEDKLWFFLDEMASLQLQTLKTSLTQGRKYGIVHVGGVQNEAQMRAIYGKDMATTQRSNFQTFVIMRVSDEETQQSYAKQLGEQWLDEQSEGLSYGVADSKDGGSINTQRRDKAIVHWSSLGRLPDCTGYLKIVGDYPIAKVSVEPRGWPQHNEGYIPRAELALSSGKIIKQIVTAPDSPGRSEAPQIEEPAQDTQAEENKFASLF